jgi:hypothetical protein
LPFSSEESKMGALRSGRPGTPDFGEDDSLAAVAQALERAGKEASVEAGRKRS